MNNRLNKLTKDPARPLSPRRPFKQFCLGLAGMTLACFAVANKAEAADSPYTTRKQAETMQQPIIANGVFPLTQEAADASLDAIAFIAATVRGYDSIHVTGAVRPLWRARLAYWYPQLPVVTQQWYANAPQILASMRTQWPPLDPWRRAATLQQWTMDLPYMLAMVEPVLAQAQAVEMQQVQRPQIADWQAKPTATPPTVTDSQQAIDQLNSNMRSANQLGNYNTLMTGSTINLMNAMSGR